LIHKKEPRASGEFPETAFKKVISPGSFDSAALPKSLAFAQDDMGSLELKSRDRRVLKGDVVLK